MQYISAERRDQALWITFSRPAKLNVLHAADLAGLRAAIEDPGPGVRALVFAGAGSRAFSAGLNVEAFTGLDPAGAHALISDLAAVMQAIRCSPLVSVAAVQGYCLGGAFELALACDLRVATPDASFGLPEIKVGVPSVIDAALLPAFVGLSKAREMILTGDLYRLDELPPGSIANVVAESAGLVAATRALLGRTAAHTPTVTAAQRRLFGQWLATPVSAAIEASKAEFAGVFAAAETLDQIDRHYRRITG